MRLTLPGVEAVRGRGDDDDHVAAARGRARLGVVQHEPVVQELPAVRRLAILRARCDGMKSRI